MWRRSSPARPAAPPTHRPYPAALRQSQADVAKVGEERIVVAVHPRVGHAVTLRPGDRAVSRHAPPPVGSLFRRMSGKSSQLGGGAVHMAQPRAPFVDTF